MSKDLPRVLQPLRAASPMKWASEALLALELGGGETPVRSASASVSALAGAAAAAGAWLRRRGRPLLNLLASVRGGGAHHAAATTTAGAEALSELGIEASAAQSAPRVLLRMVLSHSAAALVGLFLQNLK
jgi:hypothetical protein